MTSADGVFVISKAVELFVESLAIESYTYTANSKKKTISRQDVEKAIDAVDALAFLDGAMDDWPKQKSLTLINFCQVIILSTFYELTHSLIRGVLIQSCSAVAKNFTNYVFCHPQYSGVIQDIENRCAILTLFVYVDYYQNNQFYRVKIDYFKSLL